MKFFENIRNLKIYKASGTKFSRSVDMVLLEIQKAACICTSACKELLKTLEQHLCRSLSPLNLNSENNQQSSKHEPVIYYTEALKDFKIADN